jgi:hypothetical protein
MQARTSSSRVDSRVSCTRLARGADHSGALGRAARFGRIELIMLFGLLSILRLTSPAQAAEAPGNWRLMSQGEGREGVTTWSRRVDGLAVKAFRGSTDMHQTVPVILAVLADIPKLPLWIYQCQLARQLPGLPLNHTYVQFKGMWPAAERDVLMHSTVSQQDDGSILLESRQADGYALQDGFVRVPYLHNSFRLMPLKGGWTRLTFETQVDPGGLLPAWLINLVATQAPVVTIDGLRRQAKLPAYQIKSLDSLPTHYLKGRMLVIPPEHLQSDASGAVSD